MSLARIVGVGLHVLVAVASPAAAQDESLTPVAVELVLALDSSASVDKPEFDLELQGLAWALRQPEVIEAVDTLKPLGAAVAVVQWGGPGDTRVVIPFTHLETGRDAKAMGHLVSRIQRWHRASSTSIATAITDSIALLEGNRFEGLRLIIDVAGDGKHNTGESLPAARALAQSRQIMINGLPIVADDETLSDYYRDNVISGPGAFVEPARDFEDFARAIREKLVKELRPIGS
jgi:hypothetical protein